MSAAIKLLIADDHSIIREGLGLILEMADDIKVVGEASGGQEAIDLAAELEPDVVLMDLRMPGVDGIAAIEHIREHQPGIAIIILTTYDEDELMLEGLKAGARGYRIKDVERGRLIESFQISCFSYERIPNLCNLRRPPLMTRDLESVEWFLLNSYRGGQSCLLFSL